MSLHTRDIVNQKKSFASRKKWKSAKVARCGATLKVILKSVSFHHHQSYLFSHFAHTCILIEQICSKVKLGCMQFRFVIPFDVWTCKSLNCVRKFVKKIFVKNIFSFRCNQFHVLLFSTTMAAKWKFEVTATFIHRSLTLICFMYLYTLYVVKGRTVTPLLHILFLGELHRYYSGYNLVHIPFE